MTLKYIKFAPAGSNLNSYEDLRRIQTEILRMREETITLSKFMDGFNIGQLQHQFQPTRPAPTPPYHQISREETVELVYHRVERAFQEMKWSHPGVRIQALPKLTISLGNSDIVWLPGMVVDIIQDDVETYVPPLVNWF